MAEECDLQHRFLFDTWYFYRHSCDSYSLPRLLVVSTAQYPLVDTLSSHFVFAFSISRTLDTHTMGCCPACFSRSHVPPPVGTFFADTHLDTDVRPRTHGHGSVRGACTARCLRICKVFVGVHLKFNGAQGALCCRIARFSVSIPCVKPIFVVYISCDLQSPATRLSATRQHGQAGSRDDNGKNMATGKT